MDGTWTISELADRAAATLAADGSAPVSGRVRDMPNERLIRWYTTIGLVDPPLGRRGRTALYGPRHLLQLVAVKRRQAAGRSIAEIQLELTAATDAALERIAALPFPPTAPPHPRTKDGAPTAFTSPDGGPPPPAVPPDMPARTGHPPALTEPATEHTDRENTSADDTDRTDATAPTAPAPTDPAPTNRSTGSRAAPAGEEGDPSRRAFWSTRPDVSYTEEAAVADGYGEPHASAEPRPAVVQGVRLSPGLTLLLEVPALDGEDLAAIETAARPLLDELRRRGLLVPASPAFPSADPSRRFQ